MSEKIYDDDDGDDNDHDDHNYETIMLKVVQYISHKCCRCVSTVPQGAAVTCWLW